MNPTVVAIGVLLVSAAILFFKYDHAQQAAIKDCRERNIKLEEAQQARINYESLNKIDDGTSGVAVAMMRLSELEQLEAAQHAARMNRIREQEQLLQESIRSFSEARNPTKKGNRKVF